MDLLKIWQYLKFFEVIFSDLSFFKSIDIFGCTIIMADHVKLLNYAYGCCCSSRGVATKKYRRVIRKCAPPCKIIWHLDNIIIKQRKTIPLPVTPTCYLQNIFPSIMIGDFHPSEGQAIFGWPWMNEWMNLLLRYFFLRIPRGVGDVICHIFHHSLYFHSLACHCWWTFII